MLRNIIGWVLFSIPVIVLFALCVYEKGWLSALVGFGIITFMAACVIGGMMLIDG